MKDMLIIARKCKCGKVWCPECARYYRRVFLYRLSLLHWNKIRHITLTLDPKKFKADLETYRFIVSEVSYFIQNLKRKGINIKRYIKVIEFHKSGLPHFHLLVETDNGSMIGKDFIQSVWGYGNCWERYFKNEHEFNDFTGYFNKHGYFQKEKDHQVTLPDYLMKTTEIIRKYNYSFNYELVVKSCNPDKNEKKENPANKTRCLYTNEERLSKCGEKTKIECQLDSGNWQDTCIINIPFKVFINIFYGECIYKDGIGFVIRTNRLILYNVLKEFDNNVDLCIFDRIEKGFLNYSDIERRIEFLRNI